MRYAGVADLCDSADMPILGASCKVTLLRPLRTLHAHSRFHMEAAACSLVAAVLGLL